MKFCRLFATTVLAVSLFVSVNSQTREQADNFVEPWTMTANEHLALNALRTLHSAEMTYRNAFGNGNYGNLAALQQADLIDAMIAGGQRYGYRFVVTTRAATATMQPGYDVYATPSIPRPRALSFYMNESCDIRGADRRGRDATISDRVIEPCGTSIRSENENMAMLSMRTIHSGQMTYQATYGAGQYGTPTQLYNANIVQTGFILSYIWRGYVAEFTATPSTTTDPARFTVRITPHTYGRSGVRSFYIDETGVLRGADKNGLPAGPTDPPVNN
ncbi:MAG TPA: hypothetical protein PKA82_16545 [Pyrinomonadaceae bacterium]|nr:hypothetical protein [Pyrinomonadaceae bacterium]